MPQLRNGLAWTITIAASFAAVAVIFIQNDAFYRDFSGYFSDLALPPPKPPPTRLTLDFSEGRRRAFEGQTRRGMTVVTALRASAAAGAFEVRFDDRGRILAIAGVENTGTNRWHVYLNGELVADLPGHVEVSPGDRILVRYE